MYSFSIVTKQANQLKNIGFRKNNYSKKLQKNNPFCGSCKVTLKQSPLFVNVQQFSASHMFLLYVVLTPRLQEHFITLLLFIQIKKK